MPTYYARGISMHLGVWPLQDTITPKVVLKKGETAKEQCEIAEKQLSLSKALQEERVDFPGDELGFDLNWLGGAPFMQAQAGKHLFESNLSFNPTTRTAPSNSLRPSDNKCYSSQDTSPLALSLHVKLSEKTFVQGLSKQNKVHLKVDVFFNGQLSSCLFIPIHDVRSGAKPLQQVFAGFRTDFLAERPWVLLPPKTDVDGTPRKAGRPTTFSQRWQDISEALLNEANERGMDSDGNIPPSAEFLKALSAMQILRQVKDMQGNGSRAFGVIDVVITAGDGRKVTSGTTYLTSPQRLVDENFPYLAESTKKDDRANGVDFRSMALPTPELIDADTDVMESEHPAKRHAVAIEPPSVQTLAGFNLHPAEPQKSSPFLSYNQDPNRSFSLPYPATITPLMNPTPYSLLFNSERQTSPTGLPSFTQFTPQGFLSSSPQDPDFERRASLSSSLSSLPSSLISYGITDPFQSSSSSSWHESAFSGPCWAPTMLPPKHFYTVPKKPTSSLSPKRKLAANNTGKSSQNSFVYRLVITGKAGSVVVDHRWTPPQLMDFSLRTSSPSRQSPIVHISTDKLLPNQPSPQAKEETSAALPTVIPGPAIVKRRNHSRPEISQHRAPSGGILGVQGPKATTFWLENPEEVLREAAKQRRSRSPIKKAVGASTGGPSTPKLDPTAFDTNILAKVSSSPLSSLSSTPEHEIDVKGTSLVQPMVRPASTMEPVVPRLDGSPERGTAPASYQNQSPSSSKLNATAFPQLLPRQQHSTPQSSPSPGTKKRKAHDSPSARVSRSPDRLRTTSNPPLNENCVIAFAESADKDSKQGVLRQVRGERQGVFSEEYVVLATRYYIGGN